MRGALGDHQAGHRGSGGKLKRDRREFFCYRLAELFGEFNVEAVRDAISPDQIDKWIAYRSIRWDFRDELLATLRMGFTAVANAWGGKFEPKNFDPTGQTEKEEPKMSPTQFLGMQQYGIVKQGR